MGSAGYLARMAASMSKQRAGVTFGCKRAQGGILYCRAVGQRIGEGNPQFQRIGSALDQRIDNLQRQIRLRVAEHHEGNERAFLPEFAVAKTYRYSVSSHFSSRLQNVVHGKDVLIAAAGKVHHQQLLLLWIVAHHS
ncbi:Uncharacterised protein [Klebsiella oxytoca]|nr:Uncharacterised protein [Klebsiella oxytoca]